MMMMAAVHLGGGKLLTWWSWCMGMVVAVHGDGGGGNLMWCKVTLVGMVVVW
jgi:hypothetical protein